MSEEDPFADVPSVEEDLARSEQRLSVHVEHRTYDKPVTVVEGFDSSVVDVSAVASELKSKLGAGGTVDGGTIEVQGDHAERVRELLEDEGFAVER